MVQVLIITQGRLADELLEAAGRISGSANGLTALSLDWEQDVETAARRIEETVTGLEANDGLLILTDVFGGTPYNLATQHYQPGQVEILAGVNLPIVVRLACRGTKTRELTELAEWIEGKGRASVCLGGMPQKPRDLCRKTETVGSAPDDG